jgi:ATP-dependent Clp protease protease subunit
VNVEGTNNKFEIVVNKFTEESSNKFAKELNEAASLDPNHPITVSIDSYGGYAYSLINMMESLRSVPNPIITVCKGKAMSCGAILLAMGDHRFCGKDSSIMIHEISGGAIGHIDDIKVDAAESVRLNLQIMTQLAERMGMSYEDFKAKIHVDGRRDWYLTPQEAKEVGLVHQIGMPLIKPIVMYSIDVVPEKRISIEKMEPEKKVAVKKRPKTKAVSKTKKRK